VTNTELGWKSVQLIGAWTLEQLLLVEAAKGNGADDNTLQKIRNYRKLGYEQSCPHGLHRTFPSPRS
jgi:hypothetical protein